MDAYPAEYLLHNLPFIILSGLGEGPQEQGNDSSSPLILDDAPRISFDLPPVASEVALQLREIFLQANADGVAWDGRAHRGRLGAKSMAFKMRSIGREYSLPSRKAWPPVASPDMSSVPQSPSPRSLPVLHSPISPLTPSAPVFPDGLMTPLWITKHQNLLPCAFISFFSFTADPNLTSLHDNQLKNEIGKIKKTFANSSYKTRYVVVLLSEKSILESPDVEERLANIRRATGLDPKNSLFFLPPRTSAVEVRAFVGSILSTLQPLCVEYYRELSKHSRRKRNRGTIPPPTAPPTYGTSRTLSSQGWNVRYEFKLGVLAEFRQEMDAAARNFEGAYESLLGQDVFESIASWSPRWNEARLLADVIAIRILRSLLWNGQTTSAVRKWHGHRDRIRDLVDRRGKGSLQYGWRAWEARWARTMAELVQRSGLSVFDPVGSPSTGEPARLVIHSPAEKAVPVGERLPPWELLHHAGYWHVLSTRHLYERRRLAQEMPEEDRNSPGQSPASQVASKAYTYDTYLCPEPHQEHPLPGKTGVSHSRLILDALELAAEEFEIRGQKRAVQQLTLDIAREEMREENWAGALRVLRPLWQSMSWRREAWWSLVEDVGWALRDCAEKVGDAGSIVAAEWELLCNVFTSRADRPFDLGRCLRGVGGIKSKPAVVLRAGDVVSFLTATYAFRSAEGHVGEPLPSQLAVTSHAREGSAPVTLSDIRITYDGSLRAVVVRHKPLDAGSREPFRMQKVQLREPSAAETSLSQTCSPTLNPRTFLVGEADLTLSPDQVNVFELMATMREAGDLQSTSVTFSLADELFDVELIQTLEDAEARQPWWTADAKGVRKHGVGRENASTVKVLPKPPKMLLHVVDPRTQFYTDEQVTIKVEVVNEEDEAAEASLEVRILAHSDHLPQVSWVGGSGQDGGDTDELPGHRIGQLAPGASKVEAFTFAAGQVATEHVAEIKVLYHLPSDLDTPVSKTLSVDLPLVGPFEANYDFSPRVHPAPWPDFFKLPPASAAGEEQWLGITQRWCLAARVASFATEELVVEEVELPILGIDGGINCTVVQAETARPGSFSIRPKELEEVSFDLAMAKRTLEDRRSSTLDLSLSIRWRRTDDASGSSNVTSLAAPRLLVPGGEPRALASVQRSTAVPGLLLVDYTLENPSMHLLSWGLTMEASEDFAFSGPKTTSLQIVPFSRHTVRYKVLPWVRGGWIQPQLRVVDRYFNRTLKVGATEGMRMDKRGILIWVDAE